MASTKEYLDFILEQLSELDEIYGSIKFHIIDQVLV